MTRPSWDQYFMSIAHTVATRSPCVKRQVGAVLVSEDKALLATGYNGPPRGAPHRDDKTCVRIGIPSGTQADVVCCAHAESNAIAQAARHGVPVKGSTLYVTTSPCAWCARGIINAGVVRVVREGAYNDPIAAGVFAESGVPVEELPAAPVSPELQRLAACMSLPAGSGMAEISTEIQRLQEQARVLDAVQIGSPEVLWGEVHAAAVACADRLKLTWNGRSWADLFDDIPEASKDALASTHLQQFIAKVDLAAGGTGFSAPEVVLAKVAALIKKDP